MKLDHLSEVLNYIGGDRVPASSGKTLDNHEPATGALLGTLPASDGGDVAEAVAVAREALATWGEMSAEVRGFHMENLARGIEENLEAFSRAETIDNGKPIAVSKSLDIPRAAANLRFFAGAARYQHEDAFRTRLPGDDLLNVTVSRPVGVAGCISPWNLPLYLFTWKIAPALAAGCTVVGKPSEVTPVTADLLAKVAIDVGFPSGVLNIVHGSGPDTGSAIVGHADIPALSFTGGTATGAMIASQAAPTFKKTLLELGGKNPTIIMDDAELDAAVEGAFRAAYSNQGQICLCGSRILVHESLMDDVTSRLQKRIEEMVIGDPLEESTMMGALVSEAHRTKVEACLKKAREEGGEILTGGDRYSPEGRCADGYFLTPALIRGLAHSAEANQQEIFGPVATLTPFADEEEALYLANDVSYGLSASLWTQSVDRAMRMSEKIEAGTVWVNTWMKRDLRTVFGGVKDSGLGREGGSESLRFFQEPTNICLRFDSSS